MAKRKVSRKVRPQASTRADMILKNQFFGMLLIAIAVGALIVFVRYLFITLAAPADVYLVEPSQLIPGMAQ